MSIVLLVVVIVVAVIIIIITIIIIMIIVSVIGNPPIAGWLLAERWCIGIHHHSGTSDVGQDHDHDHGYHQPTFLVVVSRTHHRLSHGVLLLLLISVMRSDVEEEVEQVDVSSLARPYLLPESLAGCFLSLALDIVINYRLLCVFVIASNRVEEEAELAFIATMKTTRPLLEVFRKANWFSGLQWKPWKMVRGVIEL